MPCAGALIIATELEYVALKLKPVLCELLVNTRSWLKRGLNEINDKSYTGTTAVTL